jgi:hypothetical protein
MYDTVHAPFIVFPDRRIPEKAIPEAIRTGDWEPAAITVIQANYSFECIDKESRGK